MKRVIPGRRSRAADLARLAGGLAAPAIVLGAVGTRFGVVPTLAVLPILLLGFILALTALGLAIYALADIWVSGADGARSAIAAIIYASPAIALLALIATAALYYPRLSDISTDVEEPPAFADAEAPRSPPDDEMLAVQRRAYPDVDAHVYAKPLGDVYAAARDLIEERGWAITHDEKPRILPPPAPAVPPPPPTVLDQELLSALAAKAEMTQSRGDPIKAGPGAEGEDASPAEPPPPKFDIASIEATAETPMFGFLDDVVVRLLAAPGGGTRVDIRSASRVGRHDLGQNARRIRGFLRDLDAILQPEETEAAARR